MSRFIDYMVIAFLLFILGIAIVYSAPLAIVTHKDITITLTDEVCARTDVVGLPNKAIWREQKNSFNGCFDIRGGSLVVIFWEDRTISVIPLAMFSRPIPET